MWKINLISNSYLPQCNRPQKLGSRNLCPTPQKIKDFTIRKGPLPIAEGINNGEIPIFINHVFSHEKTLTKSFIHGKVKSQ